jgi:hypothetical protein
MDRIPEVILLPISRAEALLILDALSEHHLQFRDRGTPSQRPEMYNRLMSKIADLMNDSEPKPQAIR